MFIQGENMRIFELTSKSAKELCVKRISSVLLKEYQRDVVKSMIEEISNMLEYPNIYDDPILLLKNGEKYKKFLLTSQGMVYSDEEITRKELTPMFKGKKTEDFEFEELLQFSDAFLIDGYENPIIVQADTDTFIITNSVGNSKGSITKILEDFFQQSIVKTISTDFISALCKNTCYLLTTKNERFCVTGDFTVCRNAEELSLNYIKEFLELKALSLSSCKKKIEEISNRILNTIVWKIDTKHCELNCYSYDCKTKSFMFTMQKDGYTFYRTHEGSYWFSEFISVNLDKDLGAKCTKVISGCYSKTSFYQWYYGSYELVGSERSAPNHFEGKSSYCTLDSEEYSIRDPEETYSGLGRFTRGDQPPKQVNISLGIYD